MPEPVGDRTVYVSTRTSSQTVNICCPDGTRGRYEHVWRISPPHCSQQEMGALVRRFGTVRDLEEWLISLGARRDPSRETECHAEIDEHDSSASLSKKIDTLVRRRFDDFGRCIRGQNHKAGSFYQDFCRMLETEPANAERLVTCLLNDVFMMIRLSADQVENPGEGRRGRLRRKLALSADRLEAVKRGECLEEVLERLVAELMPSIDPGAEWFNQLNVIGGFFDRSPMHLDLLRKAESQPRCLQLIELKAWPPKASDSVDHPLAAALQLFVYVSTATILSTMKRDRPGIPWPEFDRLEMSIAAPRAWYDSFGTDGDVHGTLECLRLGVSTIPDLIWAPYTMALAFHTPSVVIELEKDEFVQFFQQAQVRDYRTVGSALEAPVLERLRECFREAFTPWPRPDRELEN